MPIEEKVTQDATPEETSPAKSKGPLMLIIIAAGVFVIGIGAFSVFMGVFSSPPAADLETSPDSLSQAAVDTTATAKDDEMSELARMEREIFGHEDIVKADDLDELSKGKKDADGGKPEPDPAQEADWIKAEKAKLAKERAALDAREKKLDARDAHFKEIITQIDEVESSRISALAKLYDGMKPAQVAPLINQLTDVQAVQVLLNMKPSNAAKILGVMNPDRAAHISENMITLNKEK
jgi:flagellar motility protein MotE (MotC chaperone)